MAVVPNLWPKSGCAAAHSAHNASPSLIPFPPIIRTKKSKYILATSHHRVKRAATFQILSPLHCEIPVDCQCSKCLPRSSSPSRADQPSPFDCLIDRLINSLAAVRFPLLLLPRSPSSVEFYGIPVAVSAPSALAPPVVHLRTE